MPCIIGRKLEMTQEFKDDGTVVPVTLVKAEPNLVTQVRTQEDDGYVAIQLGAEKISEDKLKSAQAGHLKDLEARKILNEFRVDSTDLERGDEIDVEAFEPGMKVDVSGVSKGRGFAGVMKRHGFKGGPATHGQKDQHRAPGSIAVHGTEGGLPKGKRMAGRMGGKTATVKNLEVVSIKPEKNILAIKGGLPGSRNGILLIQSREGKTVWQR
jgi:large subunit ribosomal protein L3